MTHRTSIVLALLLSTLLVAPAAQAQTVPVGACPPDPVAVDADAAFSPRRQDGIADTLAITVGLTDPGTVTIEIRKSGTTRATIPLGAIDAGSTEAEWDGSLDGGGAAATSRYLLAAIWEADGCLNEATILIRADNKAPTIQGLAGPAATKVHAPGTSARPFKVAWDSISEPATIVLEILRVSSSTIMRTVRTSRSSTGQSRMRWSGYRGDGGLFAPGEYRWRLRLIDRYGNPRRTSPRSFRLSYRTCGSGGPTRTFHVLVEDEVPTTRPIFAAKLFRMLCEPKSWINSGRIRWRYERKGTTLVGLRTASSTERRCLQLIGLSVRNYYSCASYAEVVLNADRWFRGSDFLPLSVARYRRLLVNHELGHAIGQRHRGCRGSGKAPVMMQQSKGTNGCTPNEYPLRYELASL